MSDNNGKCHRHIMHLLLYMCTRFNVLILDMSMMIISYAAQEILYFSDRINYIFFHKHYRKKSTFFKSLNTHFLHICFLKILISVTVVKVKVSVAGVKLCNLCETL